MWRCMGRRLPQLGAAILAPLLLGALPATAPAAPSCAEGPQAVGEAIVGTPCADLIRVPPNVVAVHGGAGDDTIVPAPIAASAECPDECRLGIGSQTFYGGPGDDVVFGERGNDRLYGEGGDDRLYGGIGDDLLRGGPGDDLLSGGFGYDSIDGEEGSDYARGDATIDKLIADSGEHGADTLSFSTGVTPGFSKGSYFDPAGFPNFPPSSGGRGAYVNLGSGLADDGTAPLGGGVDQAIEGTSFETVIGTPFPDFIVGASNAETIYGGGGADVILGEGGDDHLYGGADGDHLDGGSGSDELDGGPGEDHCENASGEIECDPSENSGGVVLRDSTKISVGMMRPSAEAGAAQLYLSGSDGDDDVTATYSAEPPYGVSFDLAAGSFDQSLADEGGCDVSATEATCSLGEPPDSIVLAGLVGDDALKADGFPRTTSVYLLGGEGDDSLRGGESEDVLVDGPGGGADATEALGGDDALLHNGGADSLDGGVGNDLFLSNSLCDGDLLNGGEGNYRDNASWTKLKDPVAVRLGDPGLAGRPASISGEPDCSGGGSLDHLDTVEDLEGSAQGDFLYGDSGNNQLLGHLGSDSYYSESGNDTILANSGDADPVIDCGGGEKDIALVDHPEYGDAAPAGCENVYEADPNEFAIPEEEIPAGEPPVDESPESEPPLETPGFSPPATPAPPGAAPAGPTPATAGGTDSTPPRTRILRRPRRLAFSRQRRRRVSFAFASNEAGSGFRCKLDRGRFGRCRSPRRYRVRSGRHVFRVYAVDAVGNRDRSPALFRFRVRRRG